MKLKLIGFALFLIFLAAFVDNVLACSCAAKSTVLESFQSSELVIVAKTVSVEMSEDAKGVDLEAKIKKTPYDDTYRYVKSIKMRIEKVYKGSVKVGDELLFGQGGGSDCLWTFGIKSVGESYLFYLDKPSTNHPFFGGEKLSDTPAYFPVTCGRSQNIVGYETDDLKYLNNLEKVKGKTRISGNLYCWTDYCPNVADVNVKLIGEKQVYKTKTDEHGIYEIYDLPVGKYLINPEIPKGWKLNQYMLPYAPAFRLDTPAPYEELDFLKGVPLNLEADKHSEIDFYLDFDTAIRGKVLSPDGKPMTGVCVTAVSTDHKEGDYRGRFECTNEDGIFVIGAMPPRKYILVANADGKITVREPFGVLFYPNVTNYKDAKPIEIKLGERLEGFIIQAPKTEELITVSGNWTYSDGKPVADKQVEFNASEKSEKVDAEQRSRTDKNGRFSFQILKNLKGALYGEMYSYAGEFKNCPQIDNAVNEMSGGKISAELKTKPVEIDATKDLSNIALKFPFPSCEKEK